MPKRILSYNQFLLEGQQTILVKGGGVTMGYINYSIQPDAILLKLIRVKSARGGWGTELMDRLKAIAVKHQLPILLWANPKGPQIDLPGLESFYRKQGFRPDVGDGGQLWVWEP